MITLTFNVPNVAQIQAAGFDSIRVLKSSSQTAAGPFNPVAPLVTLVANQTSYSFLDVNGMPGDWYETEYFQSSSSTPSSPSAPEPAYLSDLFNTVRDLLGVSTTHVSDDQLRGFAYLPAALTRVRNRVATFDTVVAGGGDLANAALGALANYLAYLLSDRMKIQVADSEQFDKYRYQLNRAMDWDATKQNFLLTYENLIGQVANEIVTNLLVYVAPVGMAGPTSSGQDTSGGLIGFAQGDSPLENPLLPYNGLISSN